MPDRRDLRWRGRSLARGFLDELDFEARAQLLGLPLAEASRDAVRKMTTTSAAMRRAVLDATLADRVHYGRSVSYVGTMRSDALRAHLALMLHDPRERGQ